MQASSTLRLVRFVRIHQAKFVIVLLCAVVMAFALAASANAAAPIAVANDASAAGAQRHLWRIEQDLDSAQSVERNASVPASFRGLLELNDQFYPTEASRQVTPGERDKRLHALNEQYYPSAMPTHVMRTGHPH